VRRVIPMTTEQMLAMRDEMPDQLAAMVTLAAGTGVRQSEAYGITVDRIDFLRRLVTIDRQLLTVPGNRPAFGPPKTKASVRAIPLPQVVVEALAEHLATFPVADDGGFPELAFTRDDGSPWTRQSFGHIWRPAARRSEPGCGRAGS